MNSIEELFLVFGGAALGIAVGAAYFVKAKGSSSLVLRLATAAYAPSLAVLFVAAGFVWPDHYRFNEAGSRAYMWLQFVPFTLLLLSLVKYPGPKRLHFVLVPVAIVAWFWTFALGWMSVNGK
jgi:hypothetical protein